MHLKNHPSAQVREMAVFVDGLVKNFPNYCVSFSINFWMCIHPTSPEARVLRLMLEREYIEPSLFTEEQVEAYLCFLSQQVSFELSQSFSEINFRISVSGLELDSKGELFANVIGELDAPSQDFFMQRA